MRRRIATLTVDPVIGRRRQRRRGDAVTGCRRSDVQRRDRCTAPRAAGCQELAERALPRRLRGPSRRPRRRRRSVTAPAASAVPNTLSDRRRRQQRAPAASVIANVRPVKQVPLGVIVNAPPLRGTGVAGELHAPSGMSTRPCRAACRRRCRTSRCRTPAQHASLSGPVNVVVPVGITDSTELPLMNCAIVNWPTTLLPSVDVGRADRRELRRGVDRHDEPYRRDAVLVGRHRQRSAPSGWPGWCSMIENVPSTTSKRTWRPASGAPPVPVTWTVAVPSWPEQRSAPDEPQFGLPVIVIDVGQQQRGLDGDRRGRRLRPTASRTVIVTGVCALRRCRGRRSACCPSSVPGDRQRRPGCSKAIVYGCVPPVIGERRTGCPNTMVATAGVTVQRRDGVAGLERIVRCAAAAAARGEREHAGQRDQGQERAQPGGQSVFEHDGGPDDVVLNDAFDGR